MKLLRNIIPIMAVVVSFLGNTDSKAEAVPLPTPIVAETTTTIAEIPTSFYTTTITLIETTTIKPPEPTVGPTVTNAPTTTKAATTTVPVTTVPEPTTTVAPPAPVVAPYDVMMQTLALLAGTDQYLPTWDCIARNESGRRQVLISVTSDYGFLQINSWWWRLGGFKNLANAGWISWETYDFLMQADRFDPVFQAWAADAIWRSSGNSWRQWTVHRNCGV